MPGLRRSLGSEDLPVRDTTYVHLQDSKKKGYQDLAWPSRYSVPSRRRFVSEPKSYVQPVLRWLPSDDDSDDSESDSSIHQGFENLRNLPTSRQVVIPPRALELPPTPPTLNNSDVTRISQELPIQQAPADSQGTTVSSLDAPHETFDGIPLSPPTPQISPPSSHESLDNLSDHLKFVQTQLLKPFDSPEQDLSLKLDHFPSSHADSFKTAREEYATAPSSKVGSPEPVQQAPAVEPYIAERRSKESAADLARLDVLNAAATTSIADNAPPNTKSENGDDANRFPPDVSPILERDLTDLDKHISYVSGPEELDEIEASNGFAHVQDHQDLAEPSPETDDKVEKNMSPLAEDANDLVYRQLRERNAQRHSGVSSTSAPITVGIAIPDLESTPKMLKRRNKCGSLRDESSPGPRGRKETRPKSGVLSNSPMEGFPSAAQDSIRQVSSPPRLGLEQSPMTAFTRSTLPGSVVPVPPDVLRSRKEIPTQSEGQTRSVTSPVVHRGPERTLRHFSPAERLDNNKSVRRTSLEASPSTQNESTSKDDNSGSPSIIREGLVAKNMSIKRNNLVRSQGADAPESSSSSRKPFIRGVIPSIASQSTEGDNQRPQSSRSIRRFSREERLENNQARRTSWSHDIPATASGKDMFSNWTNRDRAASIGGEDSQLSSNALGEGHGRSLSMDSKSGLQSPRRSLDVRQFQPNLTPISISGMSDHTDVSVREANGVRLYPQNGASIRKVDVPQTSRPNSKGEPDVGDRSVGPSAIMTTPLEHPAFAALVDPPTPVRDTALGGPHVDSPLTNPRQAPQPPTFNFISPTPDIDRTVSRDVSDPIRPDQTGSNGSPQRRSSLLQRARRYSEALLVRTGSLRPRRPAEPEPDWSERPSHLSPMWRPEGFWDDFDYDSEEDEGDFEPNGSRLPPGGDTSDIVEAANETENKRNLLFPRQMSKRLPGFRGTGGFLVGNSVGIDRHGTNNRRHYVSSASRQVDRKGSRELATSFHSRSHDSLGATAPSARGGKRAQWSNPGQRLRSHVQALRLQMEERQREKRRNELKNRIGMRVFHQGQA